MFGALIILILSENEDRGNHLSLSLFFRILFRSMQWFLILAWSVISTVKTNFVIWETRDWSWKPTNFSTKPLAARQWKRADTFKSTEALRKHETMPPFSSYSFPVEKVRRKRNRILNYQVFATFPNCRNSLFHPVTYFAGDSAQSWWSQERCSLRLEFRRLARRLGSLLSQYDNRWGAEFPSSRYPRLDPCRSGVTEAVLKGRWLLNRKRKNQSEGERSQ